MNTATMPDNAQEAVTNLAALLRAKKSLASATGAAQEILARVLEEESLIRGSLQSWVRARLQSEYGIAVGQRVSVNRLGDSTEGMLDEVRLTFRFTDVSAIPLLEVALASGAKVVRLVLDNPAEVQRLATPRLALVA